MNVKRVGIANQGSLEYCHQMGNLKAAMKKVTSHPLQQREGLKVWNGRDCLGLYVCHRNKTIMIGSCSWQNVGYDLKLLLRN